MTTSKEVMYFDEYIEKCRRFGPRKLCDCYKRPSGIKKYVWSHLIGSEFEGYLWVSIITYCVQWFTVGGILRSNDGKVWFRIETPNDTGFMELDDNQIKRVEETFKYGGCRA